MKTNKYLIIILSILLLTMFSFGCSKNTAQKTENTKEEIKISQIYGDFAESYNNSNELYKNSDIVFKGLVSNTTTIEKNGSIRTLVNYKVEKTYKGDNSIKEITISVMGGLIDGDKFINSSIGKMFIVKGESYENLKNKYSGKNVRFASFEGENIPNKGDEYIVFAVNSGIDDNLYYILGGGYQQGLLPVIDNNSVKEYNPVNKMKNIELNTLSIDNFINESKK